MRIQNRSRLVALMLWLHAGTANVRRSDEVAVADLYRHPGCTFVNHWRQPDHKEMNSCTGLTIGSVSPLDPT